MVEDITCPRCSAVFGAGRVVGQSAFVCARCDVFVSGTRRGSPMSISEVRTASSGIFLYAAAGAAAAPGLPRPRVSPGMTWTGDALGDEPAVLGRVGRYTLVQELGRGGAGVVYRVHDPDLARDVALKLLLGGHHAGQGQVARFLREARAAARLDHPDLLRVHDIGWHEDQVYFTMDLVEGPSLRDVLDERGRFPAGEATRIVLRCARAIEHAHRGGLVHRDIKPANVLLEVDGSPKLADFGLAHELEQGGARLTQTGQVLGTPAYMAPEQARGDGAAGVRSDVYSLGAVLYELLSGTPPYEGESGIQALSGLLSGPPRPLGETTAGLPASLVAITERAMARDPADRYASAEALAQDLEAFLGGRAVSARPLSVSERFVRLARRRTVKGGLVAGLVVLLGAGFAWHHQRAATDVTESAAAVRLVATEAKIDGAVAQEDRAGAEAALASFLSVPEHAGTRAYAQAWLDHAPRRAALGDDAGELSAWAEAYLSAVDDAQEIAALAGLTRAWMSRSSVANALTVLATLRARVPAAMDQPEVRDLMIVADAAAQDLPGAAQVARAAGDPRAPAISALSSVITTHFSGRSGAVSGGRVVVADGRTIAVLRAGPRGLTEERSFIAPASVADTSRITPFGEDFLVSSGGYGGPGGCWLRLGGELEVMQTWPNSRVMAGVVLGDQRYVATEWPTRGLWQVDPGARGPVEMQVAERKGERSDSNVAGLYAGDLDGDGRPEIAAAVGAWLGFDVRIVRPGADGLALVDRHRLGTAGALAAVHVPSRPCADGSRCGGTLLAATVGHRTPSPDLFPKANPYGAPVGLYLFRFQDDHLTQTDRSLLPAPVPSSEAREFPVSFVGDIDGDGAEDVVVEQLRGDSASSMVVFRQADGHFVPFEVMGITPIGLVQADDDPALEVVGLRAGLVVVLGAGDGSLGLVASAAPPADVPEASDPVMQQLLRRAEELVTMGLPAPAAEAFGRASLLGSGDVGKLAAVRGAALYMALGQYALAIPLLDAAGDRRSKLAAIRCALDRGDYEDASSRLAGLTMPPKDLAGEVSRLAGLAPWELDPTRPLDPGWRVLSALGMRRVDGALDLRTLRVGQVIGELPLVGGREGFDMEVELESVRAEWASGMQIVVGPAGSGNATLGVFCAAGGGGGLGRLQLGAAGSAAPWVSETVRIDTADDLLRARLWVSWRPREHASVASLWDGDGRLLEVGRRDDVRDAGVDHWTLRVQGSNEVDKDALSRVRVRRLVLRGLAPDPTPSDSPGLRELSDGDARAALKRLPADQRVGRAVASLSMGDLDSAARSVKELVEGAREGAVDVDMATWMRSQAGVSVAQRASPSTWLRIYSLSWGDIFRSYADVTADQAITGDLVGWLEAPLADPELEAVRLRLRLARGRAFARRGASAAARQDLQAVIGDPGASEKLVAGAHDALARMAAASGDRATAGAEIREVLPHSNLPWLILDMLHNDPAFATWTDADWQSAVSSP